MLIRKGYEFTPKEMLVLDHENELKEKYKSKYKEYRVFVPVGHIKKWHEHGDDIEHYAPKYIDHDAINIDPENSLIKHFERQSGGYENEAFTVHFKKEDIKHWDKRLKATPDINY